MRCHDQNIDEAVTDYDSVEAVPLLAPDDDGGPKVDEDGDGQERGVGPGIGRGARLVDHLGAIGEQGEVAKEEEHPGVWRHCGTAHGERGELTTELWTTAQWANNAFY